ncbi:XkdW family protein [Paenibacillus sp. FSL P2-0121]|uniref:XkdW family protein n=1 Tax=Paenibacillus sp. FSL P2-0121 TaxID=2921626 RepID=UPI0030CF53D1
MNIALAIMYLFPAADPMRDFAVQDNGPEPKLHPGAEEKGQVLYEIKQPDEGEEPVEGIHYRYGIDYNLLTEGVDYDIVERGQYIAVWNLDAPQPTEAELQAAWTAYQEAEANKPPELTETEQLRADNAALLLELVQTQARQDQAEQDQAALLLSLVEGGVL